MHERHGIPGLRTLYRPERVLVLLVGESAPAGGTHYYLANSNLFFAIREAFVRVYGAKTPEGDEFLSFARDRGTWLIDLAVGPVNHLRGSERRAAVRRGAERAIRLVRETDPRFVVSIKASIAAVVEECVAASGSGAECIALPFPLMQWRAGFVEGLATVLRRSRRLATQREDSGRLVSAPAADSDWAVDTSRGRNGVGRASDPQHLQ